MTHARRAGSRVTARQDEGQLLLLVLAYAVIAALLVTVVVNVSKAYLYRRSLVAAADGAALSAANQPDLDAVYAGAGPVLPLSAGRAPRPPSRQYAVRRRSGTAIRGLPGRRRDHRRRDGHRSTACGRVRMPFVNLLTAGVADGYEVAATAHATSPLAP